MLSLLLGDSDRLRMRVSQSLLGMPALLLIQALLALEYAQGRVAGWPVALFTGLSWLGCAAFYVAVRLGLGERFSREGSLSAPQMVFAMVCVAAGYALAGPLRAAVLCLMPLIQAFGIFALSSRAAGALSLVGIGLMGGVMTGLALLDPVEHPPLTEAAHATFVCTSMAMIRILAARLARMRARLTSQRAELGQALERIRLLATRDTLTGLLNRRAALDELRRALGLSLRRDQPLVLALADLDHFKLVNDGFGHHVGDRVLQAFATAAEAQLRGSDRVARWGGEEFLFVLPDTNEAQARTCLDRLRTAFSASTVDGLPLHHPLSFSAGVARCTSLTDIDAAIERADRAMYAAKVAGRNRIRCAGLVAGDGTPARPPLDYII